MICAFCGYALKQPCAGCDRLLMNAWRHCPFCAGPRELPAAPEPVEELAVADESAVLEEAAPRRRRRAARPAAGTPELIQPVTRPPRPDLQEDAGREPAAGPLGSSATRQA